MKTFQVFLGLTVLMLVLWATATPVKAEGESITGGWGFYTGTVCCDHVAPSNCKNGQTWGVLYCSSSPLTIIIGPGDYTGHPTGDPVCRGPQLCPRVCNSVCHNY